jgi:hypothetical protein
VRSSMGEWEKTMPWTKTTRCSSSVWTQTRSLTKTVPGVRLGRAKTPLRWRRAHGFLACPVLNRTEKWTGLGPHPNLERSQITAASLVRSSQLIRRGPCGADSTGARTGKHRHLMALLILGLVMTGKQGHSYGAVPRLGHPHNLKCVTKTDDRALEMSTKGNAFRLPPAAARRRISTLQ